MGTDRCRKEQIYDDQSRCGKNIIDTCEIHGLSVYIIMAMYATSFRMSTELVPASRIRNRGLVNCLSKKVQNQGKQQQERHGSCPGNFPFLLRIIQCSKYDLDFLQIVLNPC